jgi:uncharacterized membrane protein
VISGKLSGIVFFIPLLRAVIGAGIGALADVGIDDDSR